MAYIIKRLTDGDTTIDLGRRGENRATVIDFPLGFFIDNYGEGTPSLVHLRPGDTEPYVCYTVSTGDGYLRWYITDTDTAKAGSGKCELRWNVDDTGDGDTEDAYDTRAKSIIYTTTIHPSLTDETKIPDPYKDWYDAMMEGLTPVLEVESNPVFNLLDRGSEPRKSVIYAGDKLNQDKYVVPGAWWSPGWDTSHPIEDLPAVPAGSQFRFTVTGLYESTYTSDPPRYLIRKIEAEVVYGGASTSRELNVWAQIVDTRHQTSADRMIFHEWYRIPTGGDLNILTTAVTANTAGRLGMLSGVNLDDLHTDDTCGVYWLNCTVSEISGTKPGTTGQGLLFVKKQDSTYYRQTYIPVTLDEGAQSMARWYSTSATNPRWNDWRPTWIQRNASNSPHLASGLTFAGTALTTDTDINQLLTGEYYWASAAMRPSANIPDNTAVRGRLWALDSGGSDIYCAQICYTSNFNWYIRYCTSKSSYTWTEWKQLSTKTGTFTPASTLTNAENHLVVKQSGNVVTVNGYIKGDIAATTNVQLGNISGVSMPSEPIRVRGGCGANAYTTGADAYIGMTTRGALTVYSAAAGTTLYFSFSYVV